MSSLPPATALYASYAETLRINLAIAGVHPDAIDRMLLDLARMVDAVAEERAPMPCKHCEAAVASMIGGLRRLHGTTKPKRNKKPRHQRAPEAPPEQVEPNWDGQCENCGASPTLPMTGMCGPCTFGEADTAGGNW